MFYAVKKSTLPLYLTVHPKVYFPSGLLIQSRFYSHSSSSLLLLEQNQFLLGEIEVSFPAPENFRFLPLTKQ